MWRDLIRKRKGDQFRRRGREEDKITLRMFVKAIRNLIIFYLPKTTYNTHKCMYLHIHYNRVFLHIS